MSGWCRKTDVAIVGGGPAGARAAYVLARLGARVVVYDPSHPREKPCGGGVTGRALALIADAVDVRDLGAVVIRAARFTRDGSAAHVPLDNGALVVASRARFDAALVDAAVAAGAVYEPVRVTDVVVARDGVTLATTRGSRRTDFVVGADGPNSLVRRRVTRRLERDQLSIATGFFAQGASSDEIVLELLTEPPGYMWSFPRADHAAIGICAQADSGISAGALRGVCARWIDRIPGARGASLIPYSWPIPTLNAASLGALDPAGSRWCLIGDAAGLVDPITREGIYFALASGQWAAEALGYEDATARYSARVHDEAVPELARAAALKAGFFRPRFTRLVLAALEESAAIRAVMADLIAGRQSYATLRRRLLGRLELGLAWKALAAVVSDRCRRSA